MRTTEDRDRLARISALCAAVRDTFSEIIDKYTEEEKIVDDVSYALQEQYVCKAGVELSDYIASGADYIEGSLSPCLKEQMRQAGLDLDRFLSGEDRREDDYLDVTISWWRKTYPIDKVLNDFRHDYEDEKEEYDKEMERERYEFEKERHEEALEEERRLKEKFNLE